MSPVSAVGLTLLGAGYSTSLAIGVVYLAAIYPFQYLIAETKPEPALLWPMVPIVGPFVGASTGSANAIPTSANRGQPHRLDSTSGTTVAAPHSRSPGKPYA